MLIETKSPMTLAKMVKAKLHRNVFTANLLDEHWCYHLVLSKRHHRSWGGGDGTYQAGKTNRHSNYGELAKKVDWDNLRHFRGLFTHFIFSVRFDKNGSGKIAWENGEIKLGLECQSKHVSRWIPFGGRLDGCDRHCCHPRFRLLHRLPCVWPGQVLEGFATAIN